MISVSGTNEISPEPAKKMRKKNHSILQQNTKNRSSIEILFRPKKTPDVFFDELWLIPARNNWKLTGSHRKNLRIFRQNTTFMFL